MFRHLLNSLRSKPSTTAPAAIGPAAPDPRIARVQADYANYLADYAETEPLAAHQDAPVDLLMRHAQACYHLERDEVCEAALRRVLALEPDHAYAHFSLGLLLSAQGRFAPAEAQLRQALMYAPSDRNVRFALAMALLGRNNYPEGYALFRARLEGPSHSAPHIAALPAWTGCSLEGKTLVLWSDWGGFGDDIAYIRFALAIRERHRPAKLIVAVPKPLMRLYAAQPYIDEVASLSDAVQADLQCSLIDSLHVLGLTFESMPVLPSYLSAPEEEQRYWRTRLHNERRLKVGLVWTSTSVPPVEIGWVGRSDKHLPNAAIATLAGVADVVFVSLQKGADIPRLADLLPGTPVIDDTDDLADFADTAGLLSQLDLVVGIDTGVAHLAGALGVPTLLLLKKSRGYFWPEDREDTPWYPSVRMVVQPDLRDWDSVLKRVRVTLERRAAGIAWPQCYDQA